ncbi:hypothetical protein GCM10018980_19570 [Streptomyces capoamus]|uniref:Uncharacterized protein n=1 Tax=Streptomyces capoamus TaxID=68183 RepID=A0A919C2N1_9ACTN|nr:hypothetical protein GCM10010501_33160 [Streptomyces libani subsp. rufus]GHG43017.1 hypothetical protein GCM10018980_19570 [Streptomyces capoamus]
MRTRNTQALRTSRRGGELGWPDQALDLQIGPLKWIRPNAAGQPTTSLGYRRGRDLTAVDVRYTASRLFKFALLFAGQTGQAGARAGGNKWRMTHHQPSTTAQPS